MEWRFSTEPVTLPERVLKVTDLPQAFCRPAELDDDVKANATRHLMPKEILDAVDLQPQLPHLVRDSGLHVAAGAAAS